MSNIVILPKIWWLGLEGDPLSKIQRFGKKER